MTNGVKQTLPQVLMPGAGVEAKARGRMEQGDFAEALGMGKAARQAGGDVVSDRQDIDIRLPAWPSFASKLGGAIESAREAAPDGVLGSPSKTVEQDDDADQCRQIVVVDHAAECRRARVERDKRNVAKAR